MKHLSYILLFCFLITCSKNENEETDELCFFIEIWDPVCVEGKIFSNSAEALCEGYTEDEIIPANQDENQNATCPD
ncbi:MAG: hypothetical protein CMC79_01795 [Flavobacteriaceae bacterium]|nr:hypothetical protein [Flavobacteriaceae bacterium]|tara:strand:- start:10020 stop:10247 length:228 start_codon:yes stop_codon:yes gene_type:complete